jgi:hypothetical protein
MQLHLAQINLARALAPLESPAMTDFVENMDYINALADKSDGFIWRLKDSGNNSISVETWGDDFLVLNMSVWKNTEKLFQFVYKSR